MITYTEYTPLILQITIAYLEQELRRASDREFILPRLMNGEITV